MILGIFLFLLVILTIASGFLSASETSLFSLSSSRLRTYRHQEDPKKQLIVKLLEKPHDLLVTLLIMNVFVNIMVQNISANIFPHFQGWLFTVGLPLFLTLIFGEIIPKSLALENNARIAYRVAPTILRLSKILGVRQ